MSDTEKNQKERWRLDELRDVVYEAKDPLSLSDEVLAELWRLEYKRQKHMSRGQMDREHRMQQFSMVVNILNTISMDCKDIAKTKLNIHRTKCLKLADEISNKCQELRVDFNTYQHVAGWWRKNKKDSYDKE
jgi:hypothetical protein